MATFALSFPLLPVVPYIFSFLFSVFFFYVLYVFWVSPMLFYREFKRRGFTGPPPTFPFGNLKQITAMLEETQPPLKISHNIHSTVLPYFAKWRKIYGKSFVYWLGTEPFLYVVDPEFLKLLNSAVVAKNWGKPLVFKYDRQPMFGNGLLVLEGDDWAHHKNIIAPAFTAAKLKGMMNFMVETTNKMLDQWSKKLESGQTVIQADVDITNNAAEIIARTSFGIIQEHGEQVFQKLKLLQELLFKSNRLVGVPHSNIFSPKHTMKARKLGKEIDELLHSIIISRRARADDLQQDLLGLLLADGIEKEFTEKKLSISELVDECKTFFFGGFETTGLALTWTVLLLGLHPEWQKSLREEIMEVVTDKNLDTSVLEKLVKMEWVMNEVMRLYSPAPNAQRQAREDIVIGNTSIPKGTNIWIDIVGMHHDPSLWGADVDEFRPERFRDSSYGGCSHKMGFIPFGFGGRMCLGRKLFMMEYKIVLTLILLRFSISISPNYRHHPRVLLSLRPFRGVPLIIQHI